METELIDAGNKAYSYIATAMAFQFPENKPTQVYDVRPIGIFHTEEEAFETITEDAHNYLVGNDYKFIALEEIGTEGLQVDLSYRAWFQYNKETDQYDLLASEEVGPAVEAIENLLEATADNFNIEDASLHSVGRLLEGYQL